VAECLRDSSCQLPFDGHFTGFVARLTRRVLQMEQEILTLPEYPSSFPVLAGFVLLDL